MNILEGVLLAAALLQDPAAEIRRCLSEARQAAEAIPSAPANEPARTTLLSRVAQGYAEIGDVDQALQTTAALALPTYRTQVQVQVARTRKQKGDAAGATRSLQAAYDEALKGGPEFAASCLLDVAQACVELDPARALEMCRKGVELAAAEKFPQRKSLGLGRFASIQAAAGDLEAALTTEASIPDPGYRKQARILIATARARAGDAKGTLRTLEGVEERMALAPLLMLVASQAQAGDIEGSRRTCEKLKGLSQGPMGEAAFCRGRVEAGDLPGALAAATAIESEPQRHEVRMLVAEAQLKAKDLKGALETLAPVPPANRSAGLLRNLARAQADAKQVAEAQKTARSIRDPFHRTWALIGIASAQVEGKDRAGAASTLEEARTSAEAVLDQTGNRTTLLVHLAGAYAAAQDLAGATAMMKASSTPAEAAQEIAKARARAGEGAAVRTWAAGLEAGALRGSALVGAAEGLIERRDRK